MFHETVISASTVLLLCSNNFGVLAALTLVAARASRGLVPHHDY